MLGPLLGLTRPPWKDRPSKVGQNVLMHAVFGAVTGLVADRVERRTGRPRAERRRSPGGYVRYSDDVETIVPDEEKTFDRIIAVMGKGGQITRERYGRSVRTSHAKAHALLKGELRVLDGLPEPLRQGLFATPRTYPVVVRLAHVPGELLDDRKVSTPRGMAIKVLDAEGPKVPGHEGETTHDFVLDTGKAFIASTAGVFLAEIAARGGDADAAGGEAGGCGRAFPDGTALVIAPEGGGGFSVLGMLVLAPLIGDGFHAC